MRQNMPRYRRYLVIRETKILRSSQTRENIAVYEPTKHEQALFISIIQCKYN